jgi:hypothetical protein
MYQYINQHAEKIVDVKELERYSRLIRDRNNSQQEQYQATYMEHWKMGQGRFCSEYLQAYFNELHQAISNPPELRELVTRLYAIPCHRNGTRKVQFSFATKLLNTCTGEVPLYDSRIAHLYLFKPPSSRDWQSRLDQYLTFHGFLTQEYRRISTQRLLEAALKQLEECPDSQNLSETSRIDFLLWSFVTYALNGAVTNGTIRYC